MYHRTLPGHQNSIGSAYQESWSMSSGLLSAFQGARVQRDSCRALGGLEWPSSYTIASSAWICLDLCPLRCGRGIAAHASTNTPNGHSLSFCQLWIHGGQFLYSAGTKQTYAHFDGCHVRVLQIYGTDSTDLKKAPHSRARWPTKCFGHLYDPQFKCHILSWWLLCIDTHWHMPVLFAFRWRAWNRGLLGCRVSVIGFVCWKALALAEREIHLKCCHRNLVRDLF